MKIERDKILGGAAAGERHSRHYWPGQEDDDDVDYEALFRSFMERLFANRGAFKVGGELLFEFMPKAHVTSEKLISAETSFYFHQMEEERMKVSPVSYKNDNYQDSAMDSYHYQKKAIQHGASLEEFMPMI